MQWIVQLVSLILIHLIVIYPMDSAIQRLNNPGLMGKALIYKQILLTNSSRKCMENLYLDIGVKGVKLV